MAGISLGSWTFVSGPYVDAPLPLERVIARLCEAEYDGIELSGREPHVTLDEYARPASRAKLKRMLVEHGLRVSGYSPDLSGVNPVMEGAAQEYLELFKRHVELCADLGSPAIRVDAAAEPGSLADWDYHRGCDRLAGVWAEASEVAARASVSVVWEFQPAFAFNRPSEVVTLHRKVGHPNFHILFDTAHAYVCGVAGVRQHGSREILHGGVPEFLKKLEGRVGAVHLIDSDGTLYHEQTTQARPFGDGFIDFRALAPQLLDIPKLKWWCIDLGCCPDAWDLIEPSRDFVLDLMNTKVAA
jgi:sugar phosphate isomerase/epimerase